MYHVANLKLSVLSELIYRIATFHCKALITHTPTILLETPTHQSIYRKMFWGNTINPNTY
jgi:hypothetical protein